VPYDVRATPVAERQIAALRGPRRKAFDAFIAELARDGCTALSYRLTGDDPLPQLCVRHLRGQDRAVVAFEGDTAWVILIGPHDAADRRVDVYTALYVLAGVMPPKAPRCKPPCCDDDVQPPEMDPGAIDQLVRRAGPRRVQ
jgi:hypothetical protein